MFTPKEILINTTFRSDSKGNTTSKELSEASALADSINKAIKVLETKNMIDEQSEQIFLKFFPFNFTFIKGLKYPRTS